MALRSYPRANTNTHTHTHTHTDVFPLCPLFPTCCTLLQMIQMRYFLSPKLILHFFSTRIGAKSTLVISQPKDLNSD